MKFAHQAGHVAAYTAAFMLMCFSCGGFIMYPLGLESYMKGKDILVVRKVDYNHYPEENYQQMIEFSVALSIHFGTGISSEIPGSTKAIKGVFFVSWIYFMVMECFAQLVGVRKMDLIQYAFNKPWFVVSVLDFIVKYAPHTIFSKIFAISYQSYSEGGIFFATKFMYGMWGNYVFKMITQTEQKREKSKKQNSRNISILVVAVLLTVVPFWSMSRHFISRQNGWPQAIEYGATEVIGKRKMLTTAGFRIPQLYAMVSVLSRPKPRSIWLPMAFFMMIQMTYYFYDVNALGRSYMERVDGSPLPLVLDVVVTLYRAFETLLDSAVHFYVLFEATDWLNGFVEDSDIIKTTKKIT